MIVDGPTAAIPVRATDAFPRTRALAGVRGPAVVLPVVLVLCAGALTVLGGARSVVVEPLRWMPAAVAGTAALLSLATLWVIVVRPVTRLRRAVERTGRAASHRLPRSRLREFDRIAGSLLSATVEPARVSAAVVLTSVAVVLVTGLGAALVSIVTPPTPAVSGLVGEVRRATATAAGEVRHVLQDGLAGVRSVADRTATADPIDLEAATAEVLAARPVFRSVHVVDEAGAVVARSGAEPHSTGAVPPPGVREIVSTGPTPVVVAVEPLPVAGLALVAEYEVRALNRALAGTGTATRVVDAEMHSVLGNDGYLAFAPVTDPALTGLIGTAQQTGAGAVSDSVAGTPSAIAAQRVGRDDESAELGWVVVSHAELSTVGLAADSAARASIVVLGAAIAAVLIAVGWTWQTVLRPVRRLSVHAAAVRAALRCGRAVEPLAVQRLDEIGAITAEFNRRAAQASRDAAAPTVVLSRVPVSPRREPVVPLAGHVRAEADTVALPVLARVGRP